MTDTYECPECHTEHTSASARYYCCVNVDRHGYPRRQHGDDWLP